MDRDNRKQSINHNKGKFLAITYNNLVIGPIFGQCSRCSGLTFAILLQCNGCALDCYYVEKLGRSLGTRLVQRSLASYYFIYKHSDSACFTHSHGGANWAWTDKSLVPSACVLSRVFALVLITISVKLTCTIQGR